MSKSLFLAGGPRGVLLLHGLCGNPLEVQPVAKRLHRQGYTVYAPFLDAYGGNLDGHHQAPWPVWVERAEQALARLEKSCTQVAAGGLCMGGVVSLALAARNPGRIKALLLISTTLFYDGWNIPRLQRWLLPLAWIRPLRERCRFKETEPFGLKNERRRQWIAALMAGEGDSPAGAASMPVSAVFEASHLMRRVRTDLPNIKAPALILHAEEDEVASPRNARYLAQYLGSPAQELHWFHDSYHMLTLDNDREAVEAHCVDFLCRHLPLPPLQHVA